MPQAAICQLTEAEGRPSHSLEPFRHKKARNRLKLRAFENLLEVFRRGFGAQGWNRIARQTIDFVCKIYNVSFVCRQKKFIALAAHSPYARYPSLASPERDSRDLMPLLPDGY